MSIRLGAGGGSGSGASVTSLWVPASGMRPVIGAPADGDVSDTWYYATLRDANTDGVGTSRILPSDWSTFKVTAACVNLGAGAGDVRLRLDHGEAAAGEALPRTSEAEVLGTAGAQNARFDVVLLAQSAAVTAGELHALAVYRLGGGVGDSLAASIGLLGLYLEKVS